MTKLWDKQKTQNKKIQQLIGEFTVGEDPSFDLLIAEFDVKGSIAHSKMLNSIGLLEHSELSIIEKELTIILEEIKNGTFKIEEGVEDIHSQIEFLLTKRIGEAGKKIHSGRSRNDQVLVDLKLYFKHELEQITKLTSVLFDTMQRLSEEHKEVLLPGYTHFQIAMPSSFGLWFGAYAEALVDDLELILASYNVCNKNPLGSGAGFGSSFPLNREQTTELLGFKTLNYNSVYAQMTRGKTEKILAMALSNLASTLSKISYDICLYSCQNMDFISFPDELTTGSSIMPHKKNLDVFELIRAKCNVIQSIPNQITLLTSNLPSGYHRDLQLTKESIFPAIKTLKSCIEICSNMLEKIIVKPNILEDNKYNYLFSVEAVNNEVLSGVSFRDAYVKIGLQIENSTFKPIKSIKHTHIGSIGNLCNAEIKNCFYALYNQIISTN